MFVSRVAKLKWKLTFPAHVLNHMQARREPTLIWCVCVCVGGGGGGVSIELPV